MQDLYQIIILSIVQAITEFIPVSSSAHLIFIPKLLGFEPKGLSFDIASHIGTLLAVIIYFRHDLRKMLHIRFNKTALKQSLLLKIAIATIPVGLFGILGHSIIDQYLRNTHTIILTTFIFAILLFIADLYNKRVVTINNISWKAAMYIGLMQAISLIPGTSRSGITLTTGLFMRLNREAAAKFSFLLSIPVIMLAGLLQSYKIYTHHIHIDISSLIIAFLTSAFFGYYCISIFIRVLNKYGLLPFIIYRFFIGAVLIFTL